MKKIDHVQAGFNKAVMVRGYYCSNGGRSVFYGAAIGSNQVHVIVHAEDGFWEYTQWNQNGTVGHLIDGLARDEAEMSAA